MENAITRREPALVTLQFQVFYESEHYVISAACTVIIKCKNYTNLFKSVYILTVFSYVYNK